MLKYLNRYSHQLKVALLCLSQIGCKLGAPPKPPTRLLGGERSLMINPDSVKMQRVGDGSSIHLTFISSKTAYCELSYHQLDSQDQNPSPLVPCKTSSATSFSETLEGIPKDKLVAVIIKYWGDGSSSNTGASITVNEVAPKTDESTINMLFVDLIAGRLELTAVTNSSKPSSLMGESSIEGASCWLSNTKSFGLKSPRKALLLQGATIKGFINTSTTRTSPSTMTGLFSATQNQSSEWYLTAKTTSGSGQLRLSPPALLKTVTFAGRDQSQGVSDFLNDTDPPGLRLGSNTTLVTTWTTDGNPANSLAVLTIPPFETFPGITCQTDGKTGKITVPTTLIARIPSGVRLWAALRLDSWQALDVDRWAIRVSDWRSMGITRQ